MLFNRFVFVAPLQPPWLGMLTIFEYTTWIVSCLILLISALAWYSFGHATTEKKPHKRFMLCSLNSLSVFLGISSHNRPAFSPLRIFFLALAIYALNITTIYSSKLINVFTHPPYEEQIDTIHEIIESKLPIGL